MKRITLMLLAALMLLSVLLPVCAMAQAYTVNYEYPVMLYKTSNNVTKKEAPTQESCEAGTKVTIPLRLAGVYEAVDGKHYEIIDWEYRSSDDDVWTYVSEDKWGRRYINFFMPEHDVTFGALIAERYIVEYTNLDGEDEVFECTPGEATPLCNGGYEPERTGFDFLGWTPELKRTVTESRIYTAIWEALQVFGKKETVPVGEETFEEAMAEAQNDTVIVLDAEEAQEEHDNGANDKKIVTAVKLDQTQLDTIVDSGKELSVEMSSSTVTFDKTALAAINDQVGAQGKIEIEVHASEPENLTKKQQAAIAGRNVDLVLTANITAYALKGDEKTEIHDFKGGSVEISIPYTLPSGMNPNELLVLYVADDGSVEEIKARYAKDYAILTLNHFSEYVFTRNTGAAADLPQTGDDSAFVLWLGALAAAAAVLLLRKRRAA